MFKKLLILCFIISFQAGFSQEREEPSKMHCEVRSNIGSSTYLVYPHFPIKRTSWSTDVQVLLGQWYFKFIAGLGHNRINIKHYPVLISHEGDSTFTEGTWKRTFSFTTLNIGVAYRPVIKLGLEIRQVFGLAIGYTINDNYSYPDYSNGLVLNEKTIGKERKLVSSSSIDYFFPIKKIEIGVNVTILKRFDKNIPMFNYGAGLIFRYNIPNK